MDFIEIFNSWLRTLFTVCTCNTIWRYSINNPMWMLQQFVTLPYNKHKIHIVGKWWYFTSNSLKPSDRKKRREHYRTVGHVYLSNLSHSVHSKYINIWKIPSAPEPPLSVYYTICNEYFLLSGDFKWFPNYHCHAHTTVMKPSWLVCVCVCVCVCVMALFELWAVCGWSQHRKAECCCCCWRWCWNDKLLMFCQRDRVELWSCKCF